MYALNIYRIAYTWNVSKFMRLSSSLKTVLTVFRKMLVYPLH